MPSNNTVSTTAQDSTLVKLTCRVILTLVATYHIVMLWHSYQSPRYMPDLVFMAEGTLVMCQLIPWLGKYALKIPELMGLKEKIINSMTEKLEKMLENGVEDMAKKAVDEKMKELHSMEGTADGMGGSKGQGTEGGEN